MYRGHDPIDLCNGCIGVMSLLTSVMDNDLLTSVQLCVR